MRSIALVALILSSAAAWSQSPPIQNSIPAPSDVGTPPKDATRTRSGLVTRILGEGTGKEHPGAGDIVSIHYTGWTTDGTMFDSSVARGTPLTVQTDRVIAGFGEAICLMVVGEKRRAWIPEKLAYKGQKDRPKGMLVFDIELISFKPSPMSAPPDVKAPPGDSSRTVSGLAYRVLQAGTGTVHPKRSSTVTVHYSGWTTDGKLFDSSLRTGKPVSFRLDQVIPGWTEGLQLMVEGQKMRFWIPEELAYKGRQQPYGMLVFDVELVSIQ